MPDQQQAPQRRTITEPHPNPRYADRILLIRNRRPPGAPGARMVEAKFRVGGKWSGYVSLGTDNYVVACDNARDELARREQLHDNNLPQPARAAPKPAAEDGEDRTFGKAAEAVVERLKAERAEAVRRHGANSGEANKRATRISSLTAHLIPAFGDRKVADIRSKHLNDWARSYTVEGRRGQGKKAPAANTLGNWNAALGMVFEYAAGEGWIDGDRKPSLSKKGFDPPESRPWFAPPEVEALRDYMPGWVARGGGRIGDNNVSSDVRYLLHAYVALVSCTGVRPGEEMELIRPGQVHYDRKNRFWYIEVTKRKGRGEPKPRDAVIFEDDHFDAAGLLRNLLAWRKERGCKPSSPLFSLPQTGRCPDFDDPFRRLLEEMELRIDPETAGQAFPKERVLYSLRHYFATRHLLDGVSWNTVADWMGTSVGELEKTYSKIKLRMLGAKLARRENTMAKLAVLARRRASEERNDPHYWAEAEEQQDLEE